MYDDKTATQIKKIAEDAIDSTQTKIEQLNALGASTRDATAQNLITWQSWLGNIAFALSAILGAVLVGEDSPSPYYLFSFFLFLITGLWIALSHKRLFERSVITGSSAVDEFRILYDDKKRTAFELFMEPHNVVKHLDFLHKELDLAKLGSKNEKQLLKEVRDDKTSYLNDLWLALLVSAIYFMMQPLGEKIYTQLNISPNLYIYLFWVLWASIMIIIWKYEALSNKASISDSKISKIKKMNSQLKHSKAYINRIENEIDFLKKKLEAR